MAALRGMLALALALLAVVPHGASARKAPSQCGSRLPHWRRSRALQSGNGTGGPLQLRGAPCATPFYRVGLAHLRRRP